MILAICADDKLGLSFAGRRQSKDSEIRRRLIDLSKGQLRMSDYSARQFDEPVYHGADYLTNANRGDWCFVENADHETCAGQIERIVLFRWNRHYPADVFFRFPGNWTLVDTEEFAGSSHDKITMEVYQKCE